ncbi:MAG: hypothetical protein R3C28_06185 [Pirellulaceae bacterium]
MFAVRHNVPRYCAGMTFFVVLLFVHKVHSEITVQKVGDPIFDVVDTHLFSAPTDVFPALFPDHFPRAPHVDFATEFTRGLEQNGIADQNLFQIADFTAPSAVHLGYVIVPGVDAPQGVTQDGDSFGIIPNAILPISISGDVFRNGVLFEQNAFGLNLPPIDGLDGRSHFVVENWENSDFAPPGLPTLAGDYQYVLKIRDTANAGVDMVGTFSVVPEPSNMSLMVPILCILGLFRRTLFASVDAIIRRTH